MRIENVNKRNLKAFINFPDNLYRNDDKFVPYIKSDLFKTLKRLIVKEKTYNGLLAFNDKNEVVARVLFTIDTSKKLKTDKCGFFSMYECIDDIDVSDALLKEMKKQLIQLGVEYIVGSFSPFDQDNRRGIMIKGFERAPLIFTSYNFPYYDKQLFEFGFMKQIDTYEYTVPINEKLKRKLETLHKYVLSHCDIRIDKVDIKNPNKDIEDVCEIMRIASTEINYQEAPNKEVIANSFKDLKMFLDNDYILIARNNKDNKPIGFVMAIPDYFEIIREIKGELNLKGIITFLRKKKKIKSLRCMLQYVIPEYQGRGAIAALVYELYKSANKNNIEYIEAGTIMEDNDSSNSVIRDLGGELSRIYRLYYMEINDK